MPDDLRLAPGQALALAQRLIDAGRPFHAHEVFEAAWKAAPAGERDLWQGLAQIAVGLTHARRGNGRGAAALLRRGADAVARHAGPAADGIDPDGAGKAAALADRIDRDGLAGLGESDLRIRLSSWPADQGTQAGLAAAP